MSATEALTLGIAFAALLLGLVNTWYSLTRDRVRLHMVTRGAITPDVSTMVSDVTNLGTTAITLDSVRISQPHRQSVQFFSLATTRGKRLPIRMESRTSVAFLMPPDALENEAVGRGNVVAMTACGHVFHGVNPRQFKSLAKSLRSAI